jgi:hypothetical protein
VLVTRPCDILNRTSEVCPPWPFSGKTAVQRRQFLQTAAMPLLTGHLRADNADRGTPVIDTHLHCFAGKNDPPLPLPPKGTHQTVEPATPKHLLRCMARWRQEFNPASCIQ